jgi:hypothetical protein
MEEIYGWIIAVAAGLGVIWGVFVVTRYLATGWVRWMVRALAAVWLLLPWPIQVVEGYYAPAVIVALFEGVFNRHGNPWPPLAALVVVSTVLVVLFIIGGLWRERHASH